MTEVVALFLVAALAAYVLFGGADFGAGILEATLPSTDLKKRLQAAMAPVWEANHVWLIAVVVILFVGFPSFYSVAMTRLYVPVSLALVAVLLRGTFFTLRKYDPNPGAWGKSYTALFRISSAMAPLCFGFILSGLLSGHPGTPHAIPSERSFTEVYLSPCFNAFGLLSGAFIACLFAYLAAVFFYGEVQNQAERRLIHKRGKMFFLCSFVLGGGVLVWGGFSGRVSFAEALEPFQVVCQLVAAVGIFVMLRAEKAGQVWKMRFAAGAQILAILLGWCSAQYPVLLKTQSGPLLLQDASAPWITQLWLAIGLSVVLSIVIPLLVLLYRVFDSTQVNAER
jgi:cytochrome d ubiquinol oxidase subunit II